MPLASALRPASVGAMQSAILLKASCRFAPGSATSWRWGGLLLQLLYRCSRMYGPESSHRRKSGCSLAFLWFSDHTWGQLLQEMFGVTLRWGNQTNMQVGSWSWPEGIGETSTDGRAAAGT